MVETLIVFVVGIVAGVFSGVLPGIGGLALMLMSYPILVGLEPHNILIFYITMISIDQFFGGLTAIIFGVPGSSMSVPSSYEGHTLMKQGKGSEAIMYSAISSWMTSFFGVALILAVMPVLFLVYKVWNTNIQALIFASTSIIIVLVSRNRLYMSILLFLLGNFLGAVGYSNVFDRNFMTFGSSMLYSGIPVMPVLVSLFVVPLFLNTLTSDKKTFEFPGVTVDGYLTSFKNILVYRWTLLRTGLLGSIGGFVPGMSYGMSSILGYTVERVLQQRQDKYKQGNMECLIASEGANNAGTFTQLVPLLFLGIPITASEAIIYNILESRGYPVTIEWFQSTFTQVIIFFLISSSLGLLLAGKYVNILKIIDGLNIRYVYLSILILLFGSIYWMGRQIWAGMDYMIITAALIPLGVLLRKQDTMPLIYGFILHDTLFDVGDRILIMYT